MRNQNKDTKVPLKEFLSHSMIVCGVYDYYEQKPFNEYDHLISAITYERGRHFAAFAKTEEADISKLYDRSTGRYIPTDRIVNVWRKYARMKLFV